MDGSRFDDLSRAVARVRSRRGLLRAGGVAAGGAVIAAIGWAKSDAASTCRHDGVVCSKNADCCGKVCLPADRTGRRYCCANPCGTACCTDSQVCFNGVCAVPNRHLDGDGDKYPDDHGNRYSHGDADEYLDLHHDVDADEHFDQHVDCDSDEHLDQHVDCDAHGHTDQYLHRDTHEHADGYPS